MCNHHYYFESPDGETSIGRCRHCPSIIQLRNTFSDEALNDLTYHKYPRLKEKSIDNALEDSRR